MVTQVPQPNSNPTLDADTIDPLIDTILESIPTQPTSGSASKALRKTVTLALLALRPTDPFQALLAAEAVITQYAILDAHRRARNPDLSDAMTARLRANAASLVRSRESTLRRLQQLQAQAEEQTQPRAETRARRTARPQRAELLPPTVGPEPAPEPSAPIEFPQTRPYRRWEDMTLAERRKHWGYHNPEVDGPDPAAEPPLHNGSAQGEWP